MLGMRVKNGAKKILFAVILGLPLMMAIVMPPAYAAPPDDAVCVLHTISGVTCTTDLSSTSINHIQGEAPNYEGTGVNYVCHIEKTSATSNIFSGTFAHSDNNLCPFPVGDIVSFRYVIA